MTRFYFTYSIRDPDTRAIVYVGQTSDFERRRRFHLTLKPRPRIQSENIKTWLHDTLSAGKIPIIEVLEKCRGKKASLASETKWITRFNEQGEGAELLNKWRVHKEVLGKLKKRRGCVITDRLQQLTPRNHGSPWDEEANAELEQLLLADLTPIEISRQIGRTSRSVQLQLVRLGLLEEQ